MNGTDRFVDAHVHFWDHDIDGLRWAWLEPGFVHPRLGDLPTLDAPRFAVAEFRDEVPAATQKIVHVEAVAPTCDPVVETSWLQGLHDATGWPNAIIAGCRLADPHAPAVLAAHAEHAAFRGVRDMTAGPELASPEVARACEKLADLGGSLELMIPWPLFQAALAVARQHPTVTIVLGHSGLPIERTPEYRAAWHAAMVELATADNVVCKISALGSADPHWTADSLRPWVLGCIEAFGADRCMLATNWPVDKLFSSYERLLDAYASITAELTPAEREAVFAKTAERVHRI